jgi:hypothetical protein
MPTEIFPIVLNQNNYVDANTFTYQFPRGSVYLNNASVSLSQINIFYSWGNIEAQYNNNKFKLIFPDNTGPGFTEYDVTIPYGNYSVEDLNQFLQHWSIQNNKYIVNNASGQNMYFIELIINPQRYTIQFIAHDIPTSLPAGYSNPAGMTFPASVLKPTLVTLNNNFADLIGFEKNSAYFTSESTKTPEMSPVSSVLVTCSLINNRFSNPNNVLYSFVSGSTEFGRMLSVQNQDMVFSNIPDGHYKEVTIKFLSDKLVPLYIKDKSLIIYLIVKIDS